MLEYRRLFLSKLRSLGSGFPGEDYFLHGFAEVAVPARAMRHLSHRLNDRIFRAIWNRVYKSTWDDLCARQIFQSIWAFLYPRPTVATTRSLA